MATEKRLIDANRYKKILDVCIKEGVFEIIIPTKKKKKGISVMEILSLGSITATLGSVVATLLRK